MTENTITNVQSEISSEKSPHVEPINPSYQKVGGWLLLFCVGLTIFTPLLTLSQFTTGYSQTHQYFSQFPGLRTLFFIDGFLSICLISFSLYTGIQLWRIKSGSVQLAQKYLLTFLGYQFVTALLPYMVGLPNRITDAMTTELISGTIKGVVYAGVWYTYLSKSKRVQTTFNL